MLNRLRCYYKEMFPLPSRLMVGMIVFFEIYFIILLNYGIDRFQVSIQEFTGAFTLFSFYMYLRIADDFKDFETDRVLFPHRPLPSGRVKKEDLFLACSFFQLLTVVLNLIFMNNLPFFLFLYAYGFLMSRWFFKKHLIQNSLPLALVTHNPVQMVMNLYTVSFTCIKYDLNPFSWVTFLVLWTLYFPSLIWEVSRKIRAPEDETDYTTYSKLFGYRRATRFVLLVSWIDIITNIFLVWNLNKLTVIALLLAISWMTRQFLSFMDDPTRFSIGKKVEVYTLIQESLMLVTVAIYLMIGKIG